MWIWIGGDGRIFISVFCVFTVHFSAFFFNDFIFHIFLLLTWNAKLEALTFPLSGTGGISLLGSQECAPEQKKGCNPILFFYYSIAILQEKNSEVSK